MTIIRHLPNETMGNSLLIKLNEVQREATGHYELSSLGFLLLCPHHYTEMTGGNRNTQYFDPSKSIPVFVSKILRNSTFFRILDLKTGLDLDGSNYCVLPFPLKCLLLSVGPKKYKNSN